MSGDSKITNRSNNWQPEWYYTMRSAAIFVWHSLFNSEGVLWRDPEIPPAEVAVEVMDEIHHLIRRYTRSTQRMILARLAGKTHRQIGAEFGFGGARISQILTGVFPLTGPK